MPLYDDSSVKLLRNRKLEAARRAVASPSGAPGMRMSRRELAEAANAYVWEQTGGQQRTDMTEHDIGRYERGEVHWPNRWRRCGMRGVLGVSKDAELGFYPNRKTGTTQSTTDGDSPERAIMSTLNCDAMRKSDSGGDTSSGGDGRADAIDPRFPARLRSLRYEHGYSREELASTASVPAAAIREMEDNRTVPDLRTVSAIDDALRARGELVAMVRDAALVEPWESAELLERMRASDVSPATVDALQVTAFELCCAYGWQDAARLRTEGLRWLREVERLLHRPVGLRAHQELLTAAGWLASLVGCLEYDMQLRPAAEATRRAALRIAQESGNTEVEAWAWEMAAWFALTQGRYEDVLTMAGAGQRVVGEHTAAVQLIAQEAKARARMGDAHGVRRALERGRRLLDGFPAPARPDHHFVVDPDKWDFYAMDAYRIVGDNDLASHHAQEVLRLGTAPDGIERAPMRMAEARLTLGAVAARHGELEQAVDVAVGAFRARRRSLPQLLMIAREVGDELRNRDPQGQRLVEFRDAVRSVSAE